MNIEVIASGSTGNCYRVDDGKTALLFECGIPIRAMRKKVNLTQIAGCIVSHEHQDHAKAAKDLMRLGIDVGMSRGTAKVLDIHGHRLQVMDAGKLYYVGSFTIRTFDVVHDAQEPIGWIAKSTHTGESVLYLTDSMYSPMRFDGLNHWMVECNYIEEVLAASEREEYLKNRIRKSHMSLETMKDLLRKSDLTGLQSVYLLHLSDSSSDEKRIKTEIQELTGVPVYVA